MTKSWLWALPANFAQNDLDRLIIYDIIAWMWKVVTTDEYDQWLEGLSHDTVSEVIAVVSLLREFGPRLSRPHADTLNGSHYANLKELRVRTATAQIRVAFAFDPDRQAVLLVAGDKRGVNEKRFYRQLIAKADVLYAAHLRER